MFFFLLILLIFVTLQLPGLRGRDVLRAPAAKVAVALGISFLIAGSLHFLKPETYLAMMPEFLPWHQQLVWLSGLAEILIGVGLTVPRFRMASGWLAVLLLVAVFPANLYVAVSGADVPGYPEASWYRWIRLPMQAIPIAIGVWIARRQPNPATGFSVAPAQR